MSIADQSNRFNIRNMTRDEIDLAIEWAAKEGWNPGLHDADCFFATDPHGFFIGILNEEPIGCISTVAYDENFGFLGFYIVKPEYRGEGFGLQIWQKGMTCLGDRNIGLDGVVAQQDNYKKSGFKLAYRNVRYEGIGEGKFSGGAIDLSKIPFPDLVIYDNKFFPAKRPNFLKRWIEQPDSLALGILKNKQLVGYGVIRVCRRGFKIGPLFANDEAIAENLFQSLTSQTKGQSVYLDIPEINSEAQELARKHNMKIIFETARMYTKNQPDLPIRQIFGVTTFELG